MGWIFSERCAACKKPDTQTTLIRVTGTLYELGTCRGVSVKVCPDCYARIKNGESRNFSLRK